MKICVLGLDCGSPELIFHDERLVNIRRLMDMGVYGRLRSIIPPITVPAWMCMATSQDPGSLGVYGFRNRIDHSYQGLGVVDSGSIKELTVWDQLARQGKKSILVGVPPGYPPRRINGISVGCFLTPDPASNEFTHPAAVKSRITELVGEYPVDVRGFRTDRKEWLRQEIFDLSRKQWEVVRWLLSEQEWDYFQFVDIGLDRAYHGFWNHFDRQHPQYQPGNPYEHVIPDYHRWLDEQIGSVLELLDDQTIVLLASDHGAQRLDGAFALNEWLIQEGLLCLDEYPNQPAPLAVLKVNWAKTKVWSEGGYYARIFFNVAGREPQGIVPAGEYEAFQEEMKVRLQTMTDDCGRRHDSLVFKPRDIYRQVRNIAPDLIAHIDGLSWRPIGSVGHRRIAVQDNDTGPDACNHSQFGLFVLAAPNCPLRGEHDGAGLLDMAPTLLDLAGYEIPAGMQGRSLAAGGGKRTEPRSSMNQEEQARISDRLAGLGYI